MCISGFHTSVTVARGVEFDLKRSLGRCSRTKPWCCAFHAPVIPFLGYLSKYVHPLGLDRSLAQLHMRSLPIAFPARHIQHVMLISQLFPAKQSLLSARQVLARRVRARVCPCREFYVAEIQDVSTDICAANGRLISLYTNVNEAWIADDLVTDRLHLLFYLWLTNRIGCCCNISETIPTYTTGNHVRA